MITYDILLLLLFHTLMNLLTFLFIDIRRRRSLWKPKFSKFAPIFIWLEIIFLLSATQYSDTERPKTEKIRWPEPGMPILIHKPNGVDGMEQMQKC